MVDYSPSVEQPATLIVAWRMGKKVHGRVVKFGGEVSQALRECATRTEANIQTGQRVAYDPNDEQDPEVAYLEAGMDELWDTALLEQIRKGPSLPLATEEVLRRQPLTLYALIIGDNPNLLTAYIRKTNPVQLARKSIVGIFDETLTRVDKPLLAFDDHFDVVIYRNRVAILNQQNFEALFKESEVVLAKTAEWVQEMSEVLPIDDDGIEWLSKRLRETSVMRRRVQSILKSKYLENLTIDSLCVKMLEHGLDPEKLVKDGFLLLNKETERDVLLLLNEDLWTGDFSGERYSASRKSRRL